MVGRKETEFAVLFGRKGVREFETKEEAIGFAKLKRIVTPGLITIDKITRFPKARPGEIDFSQKTIKIIQKEKTKMRLL